MKRYTLLLAGFFAVLILGGSSAPASANGPLTGEWRLGHWCNNSTDMSPVLYTPQQSYWWVPDPGQDPFNPTQAIGQTVTIYNYGVWSGPDDLQCIDGYGTLPAIVFGRDTRVEVLPAAPTPTPTDSIPWGCAGFGQCPGSVPTPVIQNDPIEGLMVTEGLQLSASYPSVGQTITATFRVRNSGNQAVHVPRLVASARGPNGDGLGWSAPEADFPAVTDLWLQPGQDYLYQQSRYFSAGGTYFAEPTRLAPDGRWGGVYPFPRVWLYVQGSPSSNARQIRFYLPDTTFTRLKVVGENQFGVITTWQSPPTSSSYYVIDTTAYWWQKTVVLEFDAVGSGTQRCVVDYLHPTTAGDTTIVSYTPGAGCSGDEGNGSGNGKFVEGLWDTLNYDDALGISGELNKASNKLECLADLATGLRSTSSVIKVGISCGGVALDKLNDILRKYYKSVELAEQASATTAASAPAFVYATATPSLPPGVYLSSMQPQPAQPGRNQGVPFLLTFINTTGSSQSYNLVVEIFSADTNKGFGETAVQSITVPVGTSQITSGSDWAVRGPGGCVAFYARAVSQNGDRSRYPFNAPGGGTAQAYFSVC